MTRHQLPEQPGGVDEETHDLPDPLEAAERVRAHLAESGDGILDEDFDVPPLYARDLEALVRLAQQPWVVRTLELMHFAAHECADAHCGFHETLGQHATFQHSDGAGA